VCETTRKKNNRGKLVRNLLRKTKTSTIARNFMAAPPVSPEKTIKYSMSK